MLEIKHDINTIFVMLGQQCNLNCKYCMQHDLIIDVLPKRFIHHDVIILLNIMLINRKDL